MNENFTMDFGWAISRLKQGVRVSRKGWNGKGMYVELQKPDENSKMTEPYVYLKNAQDKLIPWNASQEDMLAEDWGWVD